MLILKNTDMDLTQEHKPATSPHTCNKSHRITMHHVKIHLCNTEPASQPASQSNTRSRKRTTHTHLHTDLITCNACLTIWCFNRYGRKSLKGSILVIYEPLERAKKTWQLDIPSYIDPCDIRHVGRQNNEIVFHYNRFHFPEEINWIVSSSNTAYVAGVYW